MRAEARFHPTPATSPTCKAKTPIVDKRKWTAHKYFVVTLSVTKSSIPAELFMSQNAARDARMRRAVKSTKNHGRATLLLIPAMFAPTSRLRVTFHRLRGVVIGLGAEIGYEVLIDNLYPELVSIGRDVTIATRATILAHDESFAYAWGGAEVIRPTHLEDGAFIGAGALILPGVRVGQHAIVGAGSVVTSDVPPDSVVAGVPARVVRRRPEQGEE